MLENDPCSRTFGKMQPDFHDTVSINEMAGTDANNPNAYNIGFGGCTNPLENKFSEEDFILDSRDGTTSSNLCHSRLGNISSSNADLRIFGIAHEEKECGCVPYHGWADVSNFEDLDELFRKSDSTFGQGSATHGYEPLWFSSSCAMYDSEDALRMSPWTLDASEVAPMCYSSCGNWLDSNDENNMESMSQEQVYSGDLHGGPVAKISPSSPSNEENIKMPTESSSNPSLEAIALTREKKWEMVQKRHQRGAFLFVEHVNEDLVNPVAFTDQVPALKQLHQLPDEIEAYFQVENDNIRFSPVGLESSNVQESSSMSNVLSDGVSVEATSLQQLQCVMDQLDIRTKTCIRDSLYRLAWSAKQRHALGSSISSLSDSRDKNGIMRSEGSNTYDNSRCRGFMDMETNTNPVDRSVAHLLFYTFGHD